MVKRLRPKKTLQQLVTLYSVVLGIIVVVTVFIVLRREIEDSKYQARYLSQISRQLSYKLTAGSSASIRYPEYGPYDERLGYTLLPQAIKRLQDEGYGIAAQAIFSPKMTELVDYGLFPIYHEKNQAGLRIFDQAEQMVFKAQYPVHGYANFKAIPPVILKTLLFIENRELFNEKKTYVNPAVEWDRLGFATLQLMASKIGMGGHVPGGSTLATQIEKYRHSPDGYTRSFVDKFRQMGSASIRAYLKGPDTRAMRQEIALAYLNSMPLSAAPKIGEVHGLGDGLSAWFGADFNEINRLLNQGLLANSKVTTEQGRAYRQVLNILLSQRRPSYYLGKGYDDLQSLTNSHLRILAEQGIISKPLRNAALNASSVRPPRVAAVPYKFANEHKTQMVLRSRLGKLLGLKSNYELDRLDLTVKTTLDYRAQQAVALALRQLGDPAYARSAGLLGQRMLDANTPLAPIIYSLMLYERSLGGNLLRVQTDNYDQPLDINEGVRIDLGSTAKLRTLVHYLELIANLHQHYQNTDSKQLQTLELHPRDHLSQWVVQVMAANPRLSLENLLMLALERTYSASPNENFFTGGGLHTFSNFTSNENGKTISVRDALKDSVNLVFIRLMRDVVNHHLYQPDGIARWLDNPDDPKREEYLHRFADNEGRVYLQRFYTQYRNKTPEEALEKLSQRVLAKASRLTMLYRAIYPENDEKALQHYLETYISKSSIDNEDLYSLYDKYSVEKFDLQDQGYITKIHPLELWLVSYLARHPKASYDEIIEASAEQRQYVYRWLLKSNKTNAQQTRILTLLETEAFRAIHQAWEKTGYPFGGLTSSYATAIGASGDRPAALADLVGIIRNDGVRLPSVRFQSLHFAKDTPYETLINKLPEQGERIFSPEVARVARSAMIGVVEGGTASKLSGIYLDAQAQPMEVGGKTGTGDHRKEIRGKGGRLIESKFVSRAAVFTFFLGEHYFGVITAYVSGDSAGRYHFTSSLPVQILRSLKPVLTPLLNKTEQSDAEAVINTSTAHIAVKSTPDNISPSLPVTVAHTQLPVASKPTHSATMPVMTNPHQPNVGQNKTKPVSQPVTNPVSHLAEPTAPKNRPLSTPQVVSMPKLKASKPVGETLKNTPKTAVLPVTQAKPVVESKQPVTKTIPSTSKTTTPQLANPSMAINPPPASSASTTRAKPLILPSVKPVTEHSLNPPKPINQGAKNLPENSLNPTLKAPGTVSAYPNKTGIASQLPKAVAPSPKSKAEHTKNSATRYYKYPTLPLPPQPSPPINQ